MEGGNDPAPDDGLEIELPCKTCETEKAVLPAYAPDRCVPCETEAIEAIVARMEAHPGTIRTYATGG